MQWISSRFIKHGKASFIVGGQWGSEAKGAAASWLAEQIVKERVDLDIVTTNAGAQAGHTSYTNGAKRVVFHLPTVPLVMRDLDPFGRRVLTYINAGSIIDPDVLVKEIENERLGVGDFYIHPMAAVISEEDKTAEGGADTATTKIASTRKGVGNALSRKIMRGALTAKDHPMLKRYVKRLDLNQQMEAGASVLVEVPQGVSLSLNHSKFYPHTTSRDCTPASAMSDAGIHPNFYGGTMVVLRTFPIRVGNINDESTGRELGFSGGHYPDQKEVSWDELGVEAEITTVTKRVRRVFTFSRLQILDTFSLVRPDVVFLSFCNYFSGGGQTVGVNGVLREIEGVCEELGIPRPVILTQWGPYNEDVRSVNV